jgi:hypothetical protein
MHLMVRGSGFNNARRRRRTLRSVALRNGGAPLILSRQLAPGEAAPSDDADAIRTDRALLVLSLVAMSLFGYARYMDRVLPGCDSVRATTKVQDVVRRNGFVSVPLSEIREVSRGEEEIRCTAVFTSAVGARHDLTYRFHTNERGRVVFSIDWR